ncbi:hypothetical protein AVEN_64525-1 [Araneus ventricosus]|uniref:Uncharacterized protein n=1 Tax=Araneus ventricosus TaxID=182803 RepID=A0A4Y2GN53_ARAVE|nr:hypothetical protein AVEN_64525-1 [Araneus ventricosus]
MKKASNTALLPSHEKFHVHPQFKCYDLHCRRQTEQINCPELHLKCSLSWKFHTYRSRCRKLTYLNYAAGKLDVLIGNAYEETLQFQSAELTQMTVDAPKK